MLRASVGFAVVGAVIGEYLGASAGAWYLISPAEGNFKPTGVFAGIVIVAAFVEKRLITWRPTAQQAQTT